MGKQKILAWGDVSYAARMATVGFEQEWEALELIWQAWEVLIQAGLTTYSNRIELCQVVIRFLALVSFCIEFCDDIWEYYLGSFASEWIEAININNFYYKDDIIDLVYPWNYLIQPGDEDAINKSLLLHLVSKARQQVWEVLLDYLGYYGIKKIKSIADNYIEKADNYLDNDYKYNLARSETDNIYEKILVAKLCSLAQTYEASKEDSQEHAFYQPETAIIETSILLEGLDIEWLEDKQMDSLERNDVIIAAERLVQFFSYPKPNPKYTHAKCAEETGFEKTELERWTRTISRKKQAILYGSPGTGKTFIAEKLAKYLISRGNGFSELVQFHPAYSYEDFIQGIRPQSQDGKLTYPLVPGRFLEFCKKAESCQGTCVLIIDEINRANLTQVFGELMYLLEYRDQKIPLASGNSFRIPANVRIIGTMNTADRSIALVDHALRRRFAFIELRPNYEVLRRKYQETDFPVERLIETLQQVNQAIADKNYELGISFFLTDNLREDIEDIWRMEIEPYLEEYFFNQPEKVDKFCWKKIKQHLGL